MYVSNRLTHESVNTRTSVTHSLAMSGKLGAI
jgi:hypothetical protein